MWNFFTVLITASFIYLEEMFFRRHFGVEEEFFFVVSSSILWPLLLLLHLPLDVSACLLLFFAFLCLWFIFHSFYMFVLFRFLLLLWIDIFFLSVLYTLNFHSQILQSNFLFTKVVKRMGEEFCIVKIVWLSRGLPMLTVWQHMGGCFWRSNVQFRVI